MLIYYYRRSEINQIKYEWLTHSEYLWNFWAPTLHSSWDLVEIGDLTSVINWGSFIESVLIRMREHGKESKILSSNSEYFEIIDIFIEKLKDAHEKFNKIVISKDLKRIKEILKEILQLRASLDSSPAFIDYCKDKTLKEEVKIVRAKMIERLTKITKDYYFVKQSNFYGNSDDILMTFW